MCSNEKMQNKIATIHSFVKRPWTIYDVQNLININQFLLSSGILPNSDSSKKKVFVVVIAQQEVVLVIKWFLCVLKVSFKMQ